MFNNKNNNLIKVNIFLCFFLVGFMQASAQSVHSCFGLNLVEQINSYQKPNLIKTPTQTFTSLTALQNKIDSKTNHNGAVYALAAGTHKGTLRIKDKRNLCVYTNPNNPATINSVNQNFGINIYNSTQGVNSNIEILNFRITGSKFHGIYVGGDDAPRFAPRGVWIAGNEVFDVAHIVGGGIVVRNAFEGATIKIESNEVYKVSPNKLDGSGEGIYIGEGNDPQDYSSNVHIIGNYLHDLIGEAIDLKRKSANILMEYNRINNISVSSQGAVVLGLDPTKTNDSYNAQFIFRRNYISNVTGRNFDGNFIVVANGYTLIEENVMWNASKHGIDVYNDCDGPDKKVKIQNNIIWDYNGEPVRTNIGNGNRGPVNNCTVTRANNIVESNPAGTECKENASIFKGTLNTLEGFAPLNAIIEPPVTQEDNSISWNPIPSSIRAGTNQIPVKYSIDQKGIIVVQIFNESWTKIGEKIEQVTIGSNQRKTVSVNVSSTNTNTTHVQVLLFATNWSDIGAKKLQKEIAFNHTNPENPDPIEPVENSIEWNVVPTSVTANTNQFSIKYSIDKDALIVVQLFNSSWDQIGQEPLNVSSGTNKTAMLALKPSQNPTAVNYLQAKLLSRSWGDIGVEIAHAEVSSNSNGKLKNEDELNKLNILPNPFTNQTQINYTLENSGSVSIGIYSADGKQVKEVMQNKHNEAGTHQLQLDGIQLSPGIYFIQLTSGDREIIEKLHKY